MFTIAQYATLSIWRINKATETFALFITCATINAIYCSIWDIAMDWSLGNRTSKHWLLRDTLAYKRHIWFYYLAMVLDPILRFNWVFYAIFGSEKYAQHSSVISFAIATSEVVRRGIWSILRVENEHCTNVSRNRAARDVELPYERTSDELIEAQFDGMAAAEDAPSNVTATETDEETAQSTHERVGTQTEPPEPYRTSSHTTGRAQHTPTPSSAPILRQRRQQLQQTESPVAQALRRVGSAMATAHSQDYERKRKPVPETREQESDEDEDEDAEETAEAEELTDAARRAR